MSEPVIPELDENGLFKMKIHPTPAIFDKINTFTAVVLGGNYLKPPHRRKYWLAWWLGCFVGPLLMAILLPKSISFGQIKNGRFRWIAVER